MKLNTTNPKSAILAAAAACITTTALHGAVNGSSGVSMGYTSTGRIYDAAPIKDISTMPAVFPQRWFSPGMADIVAPVAQFTGFNPIGSVTLPVVDLIPLKTPSIHVTGTPTTEGSATLYAVNGRVGIGTTAPVATLHIANGAFGNYFRGGGYIHNLTGGRGHDPTPQTGISESYHPVGVALDDNMSILANGSISTTSYMFSSLFQAVSGFYYISDRRLKDVIGVSDSVEDLETLKRIAITDYTLKDKVVGGDRKFKMVIAQEVEEVYPQAIRKSTKAIPDIMLGGDAVADGDSLKITLAKETDLKAGDRVEFYNERNTPEVAVVKAVDKNVITVSLTQVKAGEKVFAYGREVNDLRSVDYDAIAMLNVSATQELSRKLDAQQVKLASLEAENAELRKLASKVEKMEALVAALEGKANASVTVSLTK